ncbi:hypothetical protein [Streptomyces aureoverticillatus]|uniref:hypothetical protein n=1 Tax=Streptomyces aureoverticillatus TaxID=66871 RepID=UPI0013DAF492|nr:hypothetical protein [Streptomyces aureoverticillatus]QIB46042.1 hypothetical protein G3H79_26225 [Streptomyces aureoverticillatus]
MTGTGCTADSADSDGSANPTEKPHPKPAKNTPAYDDQKLGDRVERALATRIDDTGTDPALVESGLERVGDGIHTRPKLPRGAPYKLSVACAGKGRITLTIRAAKPSRQTVSCDAVPSTQRITGSRNNLEIDTAGAPGATGMVGWRVSRVAD